MEKCKEWNLSFCGLNCAKCDIYEAGHGNTKVRNKIVEWFLKERKIRVNPEQVRCEGCKGSLEAHWSADCKIIQCAKKKSLQYCFECQSFPCKILNDFASDRVAHHKRTVENLKRMREIGLEAWIEEQTKSGRCVFCP